MGIRIFFLTVIVKKFTSFNIYDFVYEDFELQGYQSHSAISAPVAV